MKSYWRGSALALIAVGFCIALGAPAQAACVGLSGTADGFDKETAVSRAQLALDEYVKQYKAEKKLGAVTLSAMRAAPQPYWRGSVSENMMYKPDIVPRSPTPSAGRASCRLTSAPLAPRPAGKFERSCIEFRARCPGPIPFSTIRRVIPRRI